MGIRKIGCLLAVCLMVFMSRAYAENMQFVDANGSTGYYVDTDSISSDQVVENNVQKTLWTARVVALEVYGRWLGRRDYTARRSHTVWEIATTTKELETR